MKNSNPSTNPKMARGTSLEFANRLINTFKKSVEIFKSNESIKLQKKDEKKAKIQKQKIKNFKNSKTIKF